MIPEKLLGVTDQEQDLYRKWDVKRRNDPEAQHSSCDLFVLDLNHDPHAFPAIQAYIRSCQQDYPKLAQDLADKLSEMQRNKVGKDYIW